MNGGPRTPDDSPGSAVASSSNAGSAGAVGGGAGEAALGADDGSSSSGSGGADNGAVGSSSAGGNGSPGNGAGVAGSSALGASGGASVGGAAPGNGNGGAGFVDPEPPCDSSGPFGAPELVSGLGVAFPSFGAAPSADGLTLFFSTIAADEDIFFATRDTRANQFSSARLVAGVNRSDGEDGTPFVSADGLSLFFFSTRAGDDAPGGRDLWVSSRTSGGEFGPPSVVPGVNHDGLDHLPRLTADERTLMFVSGRDTLNLASNIWVAQRTSPSADFSAPVELNGVNTDAREEGFWLSADELTLFFASNRAGTVADMDIWVAARESVTSAFGDAESLDVVNTSGIEIDPAVTQDGFELFFASDRSGTMRLYRSARLCD